MSSLRIGVVMDPIQKIVPAKDSSLAMLLEAQSRGHALIYFEQNDLWLDNGVAMGHGRSLAVKDSASDWHSLGARADIPLGDIDVILMRKDPPFDMEYIYTTYILERAAGAGSLVLNRPSSLRDINEKVYTAWFPECCPPTLITRSIPDMRAFAALHGKIVVKPLHGMGGKSIFALENGDKNANVIFETLTQYETGYAMAQKYIPEITAGDKRIILINGEAPKFALARVPDAGDNRGNLVMGAKPQLLELTERDRWICAQVGPALRERGVLFAGLDVIGDFLTEINVTSPTGIREIAKLGKVNLAAEFLSCIETAAGKPH